MKIIIGKGYFRFGIWLLLILFINSHVYAENLKQSLLSDIAKKKDKNNIILNLKMKTNRELIVQFRESLDDHMIACPVRFEK